MIQKLVPNLLHDMIFADLGRELRADRVIRVC